LKIEYYPRELSRVLPLEVPDYDRSTKKSVIGVRDICHGANRFIELRLTPAPSSQIAFLRHRGLRQIHRNHFVQIDRRDLESKEIALALHFRCRAAYQ
jgi:hypothetical protein